MKLNELKIGESGLIKNVGGSGALRQHFLDMGIIPETKITLVKFAPMNDPIEFRIHDYELTLRNEDASCIEIELINDSFEEKEIDNSILFEEIHPGIGEGGLYHERQEIINEYNDGEIKIALAGNQNSGKTTLFNQLTGSNQHVGNFPGVTVEHKIGNIRNKENVKVIDLPGIYSLSPYSNDEIVSRKYILEEKPDAIINIVDVTNIERNLYLTMQLMELDIPIVLALNMMDELQGNGGTVLVNKMESILSIPVVPISAIKNEGVDELISHTIHIARYNEKPLRHDFCDKNDHNGALHRCLHSIMHIIEEHCLEKDMPIRFVASKIVENDISIIESLDLKDDERASIESIIVQMEKERKLDRSAAIADMRYIFIDKLCKETLKKPKRQKERLRSEKIDNILTGKYTAIPIFIMIMALIFFLTFNVIGSFFQDLLELGIENLTGYIESLLIKGNVAEVVRKLIVEGIFNGVGAVLSFVPIIVILFFFLSLLEDSGYMTRIAFVMDKLLRKIGLSGRSIVPMLIGFGCSVPAIMSTRTLSSQRDRKLTILLIPFMSCSAKMPIYVFFADIFFPNNAWLISTSLYFLGIIISILVAYIAKNSIFKGEAIPFVMELPNYRLPSLKNVLQLMWDKAKDFLQRAFTIIFLGTIIIWFFQTFDFHFNIIEDSKLSILASIANIITPFFKPLGFADWRISTALLSGFLAKESVVSTISVLYGNTNILLNSLTKPAVYSLLVFCLLYTPCIAAVAAVKKEEGKLACISMVIFQILIAWIISFLSYHLISLF